MMAVVEMKVSETRVTGNARALGNTLRNIPPLSSFLWSKHEERMH
jgi:hypothetical protein